MSYNRKTQPARCGKVGSTRSVARLHSVLTNLVNRVNTGLTTVAGYLANLGATQAFIDQYGSAFGTKASKEYQAQYGEKPAKAGLALRKGRLYRVFAYTADQLPVLAAAAAKYNRTAALVPALAADNEGA